MRRLIVVSQPLLVTLVIATLAHADGLGDAAKRAKAKRDETKKSEPVPVHTNDSLVPEPGQTEKPGKGTFNAPSGNAPSGSGRSGAWAGSSGTRVGVPWIGSTPSASEAPDPDAQKRALAAAYKRQLESIDARIEAAEAAMIAAARESENTVGSGIGERYVRARAAAEKAMAEREAIEDAARRQNIPPGWIR